TSAPATAGSHHAVALRRPTSPSSIQYGSPSGTWELTAASTTTPAPTTSTDSTPTEPKNVPSTNSKPWATKSPLPTPADHEPGRNLRVRSAVRRRLRGAPWWAKIGRWLLLLAALTGAETGRVRRGGPRCLRGCLKTVRFGRVAWSWS